MDSFADIRGQYVIESENVYHILSSGVAQYIMFFIDQFDSLVQISCPSCGSWILQYKHAYVNIVLAKWIL